jgi:hypothetical protein
LVAVACVCLLSAGNQSKPDFYVRSDGHVLIGGKRGKEINPTDLAKHVEILRSGPLRTVIEVDPDLPVDGLEPLLFKFGELGIGTYQLRSNGNHLNFSLPGSGLEQGDDSKPEFIDLRASSSSGPPLSLMYRDAWQWSDVCVAADGTIPCGELLLRLSPKLKSGETMGIYAGSCAWLRSENEDKEPSDYSNPHLPKPIWTRAADYIRGWF